MRYSEKDDLWIVEFSDVVSTEQIARDLGKSQASIRNRIKKLKSTGAWLAYEELKVAQIKAGVLCGRLDLDMMDTIHGLTGLDLGLTDQQIVDAR